MLKALGKYLILSLLFVCILIATLYTMSQLALEQAQTNINDDNTVLHTTPDELNKHTHSGKVIVQNGQNIVIQSGTAEETYRINQNTKVQAGVVSDGDLNMVVPGVKVNILAFNGVARVVHVKIE
ncbi:hypothetical protein [Chengkuizengella axinellae]|uniref:DUF3221 domain-containing protein n=1 Tax=Chengkuizengella axinellae TaxID=3064388 RepID=A0ABT9J0V0_9BACL|nr:hypothetical protein [Chengkuizengella sp. 2205SS18-9]MDP5275241.1 hypothetical protein [Chengkuizengella sp. 2205SS18-9]